MKEWLNERNIYHGSCVYSAKKERKERKKERKNINKQGPYGYTEKKTEINITSFTRLHKDRTKEWKINQMKVIKRILIDKRF